MFMNLRLPIVALVLVLAAQGGASGGTPLSVQSTVRPFNLPIVATVQKSGSDSRAAAFNANYVPQLRQIINDNLAECVVFTNASGFKLDSSKFFLRRAAAEPIRIYFLAEGAGYWNSLGFAFTPAGSTTPGTPKLIFPNASSASSGSRSQSSPVREGDFVEIGYGGNGWQLDFFLIADGAHSGQTWWWNDIAKNGDSYLHMVAFVVPNSPYVLIGFEDLWNGGDRDYNDLLFVADIGLENAQNLTDEFASLPH